MSEGDDVRLATEEERRRAQDCLRCGSRTGDEELWTLRVGGSSGGITALFGALAELGEGVVDVVATTCPACGHIEFRAPRRS